MVLKRLSFLFKRFRHSEAGNWFVYGSFIMLFLFIIMAIFPRALTSYNPLEVNSLEAFYPPSFDHIMGTDEYGRDIWSRIVYSSRVTLSIGLGSAIVAAFIGVPLGLL